MFLCGLPCLTPLHIEEFWDGEDADQAAVFRQGAELVVVEVAGMVCDGAAAGVGADNGGGSFREGIVEGRDGDVAEVYDHPKAVHFADHFAAEGSEAAVGIGGVGGGSAPSDVVRPS